MHPAIASYRKTLIASGTACIAVVIATYAFQAWLSQLLSDKSALLVLVVLVVGLIVGLFLLLVALGSLLVMYRHARLAQGKQDLFLSANFSRSDVALLGRSVSSMVIPLSKLRRWLGAPAFIVGDTVRILSLEEIAESLDSSGCLDGLPFMPEMAKFCGTTGTVFRCVDKVYDYGGKKDLRRIKDTVLIAGMRCDGSAHDGCQAACYQLWKTSWLTRADTPVHRTSEQLHGGNAVPPIRTADAFGRTYIEEAGVSDRKYVCQYTEIVNASSKMSEWDVRQDLRPLIAGNVTTWAFVIGMLTRLFNAVQSLRGGTGYPLSKTRPGTNTQPVNLGLQPGETVRVATPEKIFSTLNSTGKNLGLWFDRDMLKHYGHHYTVLRRADKIIDDASRRMIQMKTPCIVLDALDCSGEHLRFCAQHDYPFWREAWLERVETPEK